MKRFCNEDGQVLVMTVLCMGILIGALGMAVDVGVLFRARRNMQIAADSAAMAGATALYYGGNATNAATNAASTVDSGITSSMVTVSLPSSVGGVTCGTCVQVNLYKPTPTIFMHAFSNMLGGNSFGLVNVAAKSMAGALSTSLDCAYIMSPNADQALWIHGAGAIIAPGCGIYVNSNKGDALCVTGNSGKSNFARVDVVGQQGNGNCGGTISSNTLVNLNAQALPAPFSNLTDPATQCQSSGGGVPVVTPSGGTLTGSISGPGFGNVACYGGSGGVSMNNATLGPGIYVFTTGVTVSGTDTIGSSSPSGGAVVAVTGASSALNVQTTSTFNIYAPTSGAYSGLALYQSAADQTQMQLSFGSSGATFDGMIYAPGAAVNLHDQGGSGTTTNFGFVVGELYDNSNININFTNYSTAHPATSPFKIITLVG